MNFSKIRTEPLISELVYLVSGSIANVWFTSKITQWGQILDFIKIFEQDRIIYYILFFGIAYLVGRSLCSIGSFVFSNTVRIAMAIGDIFILPKNLQPQNIVINFLKKHELEIAMFEKSIDYIEIIKNIPKVEHGMYYLYEYQIAKVIAHLTLLGFFFINIFMYSIYLWEGSIAFFICVAIFLIEFSNCVWSFGRLLKTIGRSNSTKQEHTPHKNPFN